MVVYSLVCVGSGRKPRRPVLSFSEGKQQVLANLANFAYDPINYEHFRKLNILDLFLGKMQVLKPLSYLLCEQKLSDLNHLIHNWYLRF